MGEWVGKGGEGRGMPALISYWCFLCLVKCCWISRPHIWLCLLFYKSGKDFHFLKCSQWWNFYVNGMYYLTSFPMLHYLKVFIKKSSTSWCAARSCPIWALKKSLKGQLLSHFTVTTPGAFGWIIQKSMQLLILESWVWASPWVSRLLKINKINFREKKEDPKLSNWKADKQSWAILTTFPTFWSVSGTLQTSLLFSSLLVSYLDRYLPDLSLHAPIYQGRKIWHVGGYLSTKEPQKLTCLKGRVMVLWEGPRKGTVSVQCQSRCLIPWDAEDYWSCKWCFPQRGMGQGHTVASATCVQRGIKTENQISPVIFEGCCFNLKRWEFSYTLS